jgi:cellulose 1,4-beta-cellobiosidase
MSAISGVDGNSITTKFCDQQKQVFGDTYTFKDKGGMANMASALSKGMVLVMSLWDDHYSNMLWLDSTYPTDKDPSTPGIGRGECDIGSGVSSASPNCDCDCVLTACRYLPMSRQRTPMRLLSTVTSRLARSTLPLVR